jgi:hypothetical protein
MWSHVASYQILQLKFLSLKHAKCPTHHIVLDLITLRQEETNISYQIAMVTKFCMIAPTTMKLAACHATGTKNFGVTPDYWKTFASLP